MCRQKFVSPHVLKNCSLCFVSTIVHSWKSKKSNLLRKIKHSPPPPGVQWAASIEARVWNMGECQEVETDLVKQFPITQGYNTADISIYQRTIYQEPKDHLFFLFTFYIWIILFIIAFWWNLNTTQEVSKQKFFRWIYLTKLGFMTCLPLVHDGVRLAESSTLHCHFFFKWVEKKQGSQKGQCTKGMQDANKKGRHW